MKELKERHESGQFGSADGKKEKTYNPIEWPANDAVKERLESMKKEAADGAKTTDAKKPEEAKPADTKAADTKAADAKPADAKPETKA